MSKTPTCPLCQGPLVESGVVDGLGLIYMCDNDDCPSHADEHNCPACGHPTAYVWVPDDNAPMASESAGQWIKRCFDPLCNEA